MSNNSAMALDKYSKAIKNLEAHQELNKSIFDQHKQLVFAVVDAENELRDSVADAGAGVSNIDHQVTYVAQSQTFADIETLDALIAQGKIDPTLREQLVKTVSRPPRITINKQK